MPRTGRPTHYGAKKKTVALSLTEDAIKGLDSLAAMMGVSRSELVEQLGRNGTPSLPPVSLGESSTD